MCTLFHPYIMVRRTINQGAFSWPCFSFGKQEPMHGGLYLPCEKRCHYRQLSSLLVPTPGDALINHLLSFNHCNVFVLFFFFPRYPCPQITPFTKRPTLRPDLPSFPFTYPHLPFAYRVASPSHSFTSSYPLLLQTWPIKSCRISKLLPRLSVTLLCVEWIFQS